MDGLEVPEQGRFGRTWTCNGPDCHQELRAGATGKIAANASEGFRGYIEHKILPEPGRRAAVLELRRDNGKKRFLLQVLDLRLNKRLLLATVPF